MKCIFTRIVRSNHVRHNQRLPGRNADGRAYNVERTNRTRLQHIHSVNTTRDNFFFFWANLKLTCFLTKDVMLGVLFGRRRHEQGRRWLVHLVMRALDQRKRQNHQMMRLLFRESKEQTLPNIKTDLSCSDADQASGVRTKAHINISESHVVENQVERVRISLKDLEYHQAFAIVTIRPQYEQQLLVRREHHLCKKLRKTSINQIRTLRGFSAIAATEELDPAGSSRENINCPTRNLACSNNVSYTKYFWLSAPAALLLFLLRKALVGGLLFNRTAFWYVRSFV